MSWYKFICNECKNIFVKQMFQDDYDENPICPECCEKNSKRIFGGMNISHNLQKRDTY